MLSKISLYLLFTFLTLSLSAQESKITGLITNYWSKKPIGFANVLIEDQDSSSYVAGGISDADGKFSFENIQEGKYRVSVSFLGYRPDTIENFEYYGGSAKLDTFRLKRLKTELEELNIVAERPMIVESAGKTTLNVNERMSGSGESALELIKYLPSATTDEEDNVILRGAPATIMIDGVETDLANALDALPIGMIDKIEVITNPSAKYSSQNGSGIINIVLKGDKKKGANGRVNVAVGTPKRFQTGGNIMLGHKRWSFFTNADYSHFTDELMARSERSSKGTSTPSVLYNNGSTDRFYDKLNLRQGIKYQLDKSSSLRLDVNYRKDKNNSYSTVDAQKKNLGDTLLSHNQSTTNTNFDKSYWSTSLDFRKTFENESQLAILGKYEYQNKATPMLKDIRYFNIINGDEKKNYQEQTRSNPELIDSWRLKGDYEIDLSKQVRIESGILVLQRTSNLENDFVKTRYNYNSADSSYTVVPDSSQMYLFDVNEFSPSVYSMLYYTYEDWTITAGFRYEMVNLNMHSSTNDSTVTNTYHNILPSLLISRRLSDKFTYGISASIRTKMPKPMQLSPVATYNGLYSKSVGNPNLTPEKITSLEFNTRQNYKKHSINSALFYKRFDDMINRQQFYTIEDGHEILVRQYQNIGKVDQWGLDLNMSSRLPWDIRLKTNVLMMGQHIKSTYQGIPQNIEDFAWSTKITANQVVWKNLRWQLTAGYTSSAKSLNGLNYATFYSNLGISKVVLAKKGNISLQFNDIFNTVDRERFSDTSPKYDLHSYTKGISQKVMLSFSYKFNTLAKK